MTQGMAVLMFSIAGVLGTTYLEQNVCVWGGGGVQ